MNLLLCPYKMYSKLVHCVCVNLALQPQWHINTFHNIVFAGCWGLGKSGWDFGPADDWSDWKKPVALCQHHDRVRSRWDDCRLLIWLRRKHATSRMLFPMFCLGYCMNFQQHNENFCPFPVINIVHLLANKLAMSSLYLCGFAGVKQTIILEPVCYWERL